MSRGDRGNDAVFIKRHARIAERPLVAMSTGGHVLGARLHPFDRPSAGLLRGKRADRHLGIIGDLDAETASDISGLHTNAIDVDIQMCGEKLYGKGWE